MKRVGKIRVDTKYTAQEWGRGHYRVKPLEKLFLKTEKLRRGTVGGNELNYWNNLHEKQKKRQVCEGSNANEGKKVRIFWFLISLNTTNEGIPAEPQPTNNI